MVIKSGNGSIDFVSNSFLNVKDIGSSVFSNRIQTFNGYDTEPIQNGGNLEFFNSNVTLCNATLSLQIAGPTFTGSPATKLGILPPGMYNVIMTCPSNELRNVSCVLQTNGVTPYGNQNSILTTSNDVRISVSGNNPDFYLDLTNNTSGSGDNFNIRITLITGRWDGTSNWLYP
jgi:hypothetical protein